MHGDASIKNRQNNDAEERPRKLNKCIMAVKHLGPPKLLFGEFWREGELALLFGAAGTGKTVLATQIADGLARGHGVLGFKMTAKRQKVLYVDLRLSERHVMMRYSSEASQNGSVRYYKFSENLYRLRPRRDEPFHEWLRKKIIEDDFKTIVIDDLSAIRNTCDGTRETLSLMRELRKLNEEMDVSILVLAGSREPGRSGLVSEADLQRSRVLCDAADSVCAIGRHPRRLESRYLVQTRSPGAAAVWNDSNAPVCSLTKIDGTFLAFTFDERFQPRYDEERLHLICNAKYAHDAGATLRDIADSYNISKSTAARLLKLWRPSMDVPTTNDDPDDDEYEDGGGEPDYSAEEPKTARSGEEDGEIFDQVLLSDPAAAEPKPEFSPPPETPREILLALGMRPAYDTNDREIFIERQGENGKPYVWYRFEAVSKRSPEERLFRNEFKGYGTSVMQVDGPICLFNTS